MPAVASAPSTNDRLRPPRGDLAPDEDLGAVRPLEHGLDGGGAGARPYQVGGGAAAEQQANGLDQDRLPRAGLTGQGGEARLEIDLDGFDHRQVADAKRA